VQACPDWEHLGNGPSLLTPTFLFLLAVQTPQLPPFLRIFLCWFVLVTHWFFPFLHMFTPVRPPTEHSSGQTAASTNWTISEAPSKANATRRENWSFILLYEYEKWDLSIEWFFFLWPFFTKCWGEKRLQIICNSQSADSKRCNTFLAFILACLHQLCLNLFAQNIKFKVFHTACKYHAPGSNQ